MNHDSAEKTSDFFNSLLVPALQKLLEEEDAGESDDNNVEYQNTEVSACNYTDEVLIKSRPHRYMIGLRAAAYNDMNLARDFAKAGYPESVWRPALADFTRANAEILRRQLVAGGSLEYYQIKNLMRPHEKALVRKLEAYRRKSGGNLPRFSSSPFCGGDFIGFFNIRTSPPGGSLQIIREFFFKLCVVQKIDPYSKDCDMWRVPSAKAEYPQGTYRYRVKWSDGPEECGKSDFLLANIKSDKFSVAIEQTKKACER